MRCWSLVPVSFFERRADLAAMRFLSATASFAVLSSSERRAVRCSICGSMEEIKVRIEAILVSSVVMGDGSDSAGDLNLMVWLWGENEMAARSRDKCVNNTERSLLLRESTPTEGANVDVKSSCENMRDVFDVAVRDASSSTAFAAA